MTFLWYQVRQTPYALQGYAAIIKQAQAELVTWLCIPFVCFYINLLAQFFYHLASTLQNLSLDSIPLHLVLVESLVTFHHLHPVFLNINMNVQMNSEWYLRVPWYQQELACGRHQDILTDHWEVLSGFFSWLLRKKTQNKRETEPEMSQGTTYFPYGEIKGSEEARA